MHTGAPPPGKKGTPQAPPEYSDSTQTSFHPPPRSCARSHACIRRSKQGLHNTPPPPPPLPRSDKNRSVGRSTPPPKTKERTTGHGRPNSGSPPPACSASAPAPTDQTKRRACGGRSGCRLLRRRHLRRPRRQPPAAPADVRCHAPDHPPAADNGPHQQTRGRAGSNACGEGQRALPAVARRQQKTCRHRAHGSNVLPASPVRRTHLPLCVPDRGPQAWAHSHGATETAEVLTGDFTFSSHRSTWFHLAPCG